MRLFRGKKRIIAAAVAAILTGASATALAAGFQLFELSGTSAGDYNAGSAAIAESANTAFLNPAGMVRINHAQISAGVVGIWTKVKFRGRSIWQNALLPPTIAVVQRGGASGNAHPFAVPSIHFVTPLADNFYFGFSTVVPFGLITQYSKTSMVRYAATKSRFQDVDFSPSIAYAFNKYFSAGVGLDAQYVDANLSSIGGAPIRIIGMTPVFFGSRFDTQSMNQGDGWGYGWHAGILVQFTKDTRVGITYHSQTRVRLRGTSTFKGPLAAGVAPVTQTLQNHNLNTNVTLPRWVDIGAFHQFNYHIAVMASIVRVWWHSVQNIRLNNVQAINPLTGAPTQITVNLPQGFRNTWRFALGGQYRFNPQWMLRAGVGYDETPTVTRDRTVRLPDGNRYAVAIGAQYSPNKILTFDVGYTHLFVKDGTLRSTTVTGSQLATVIGKTDNGADLVGGQLIINLGKLT